jgi:hypothetical protein
MQGQLLYIDAPSTTPAPAVQVINGHQVLLTSIRIATPTSSNGSYELHHVRHGQTAATTTNTLAYNVALTSKHAIEFLTHPLPLSPGEALWVSGDDVVIAVYGVVI